MTVAMIAVTLLAVSVVLLKVIIFSDKVRNVGQGKYLLSMYH